MTPEEKILFRQLRSIAVKYGKHPKYIAWLRKKYPNKEIHHVFGSYMSRKTTDLCTVPVDPMEHRLKQNDTEWCYQQIPQMIDLLLQFISEQNQ